MFSKLGTALIFLVFLAASATAEDFGTFNGELVYKAVPGKERVVETVLPFSFVDTKGKIWTVPVGSEVDGASIPSAFWSLIGGPFTGKYREASVVHDHFCKAQTETWQDTHRVFYDGMRANGVDETLATTMYGAVYFRGPRWVVTKAKTPRKPAVSGTPLQIGSKKIDIVALAAKPGITPEQVRTAIDDALAIDQESAFVKRLLAQKADCSLVVESLDSSDASFAMCELDAEEKKILAARNLRILIGDVETLLSANKSLLLPRIDSYISQPSPENWKPVNQASQRIMRLVNMTLISLAQYKSNLNNVEQRQDLASSDLNEYLQSVGVVEKLAKTRGMMLQQNIRDVPSEAEDMRRWKLVYVEVLERLRLELPKLAKGLE